MHLASLDYWLPDRPATWFDVFFCAFASLSVLSRVLESDSLAPLWVAVGVVASLVLAGPVANSPVADRIDAWWERIGVGGRLLALVAFAAGVWTLPGQVPGLWTLVESFVTGVFAVMFVVLAVFVLSTRPVRGWVPRYDLSRDDA